jgi:hypothetical protein
MDSSINTTTTHQTGIGGIDDGISALLRNVPLNYTQLDTTDSNFRNPVIHISALISSILSHRRPFSRPAYLVKKIH